VGPGERNPLRYARDASPSAAEAASTVVIRCLLGLPNWNQMPSSVCLDRKYWLDSCTNRDDTFRGADARPGASYLIR